MATIKIVMLGEQYVGKTSLLKKWKYSYFSYFDTRPTIGVEYLSDRPYVFGNDVLLQIWDTSGQYQYRSLCSSYLRHAKGVFAVFAVDNPSSFKQVIEYLDFVNEVCQNDKINVVILGNKIDLLDEKQLRAVQKSLEESLEGLRQKYPQYMIGDIKYVSAKNNTKEEISCIVQETTEIIYARHNTGEKDESSSVIVLPKPKKKKKKCC